MSEISLTQLGLEEVSGFIDEAKLAMWGCFWELDNGYGGIYYTVVSTFYVCLNFFVTKS